MSVLSIGGSKFMARRFGAKFVEIGLRSYLPLGALFFCIFFIVTSFYFGQFFYYYYRIMYLYLSVSKYFQTIQFLIDFHQVIYQVINQYKIMIPRHQKQKNRFRQIRKTKSKLNNKQLDCQNEKFIRQYNQALKYFERLHLYEQARLQEMHQIIRRRKDKLIKVGRDNQARRSNKRRFKSQQRRINKSFSKQKDKKDKKIRHKSTNFKTKRTSLSPAISSKENIKNIKQKQNKNNQNINVKQIQLIKKQKNNKLKSNKKQNTSHDQSTDPTASISKYPQKQIDSKLIDISQQLKVNRQQIQCRQNVKNCAQIFYDQMKTQNQPFQYQNEQYGSNQFLEEQIKMKIQVNLDHSHQYIDKEKKQRLVQKFSKIFEQSKNNLQKQMDRLLQYFDFDKECQSKYISGSEQESSSHSQQNFNKIVYPIPKQSQRLDLELDVFPNSQHPEHRIFQTMQYILRSQKNKKLQQLNQQLQQQQITILQADQQEKKVLAEYQRMREQIGRDRRLFGFCMERLKVYSLRVGRQMGRPGRTSLSLSCGEELFKRIFRDIKIYNMGSWGQGEQNQKIYISTNSNYYSPKNKHL